MSSKTTRSTREQVGASTHRAQSKPARPADSHGTTELGIPTWMAGAILAIAAVICFSNSFGVPFIYDDFSGIVNNTHIRQFLPLRTLLTAPPQNPVGGRPLVVQRTESAMGFLPLLTLYASMRMMRQPRSLSWHGVAITACALGTASKESMVTALRTGRQGLVACPR